MYQEQFIQAIHERRKLRITFYSEEDKCSLTRVCAPMDIGPSRKAKHQKDYFHVWDYESDTKPHPLPLTPNNIKSIELLDDFFDPGEFIDWTPKWFIARDWGHYS